VDRALVTAYGRLPADQVRQLPCFPGQARGDGSAITWIGSYVAVLTPSP